MMKTGTEPQHIGWQILNGCLFPFRKLAEGVSHVLGLNDSLNIIRQREDFFFNELASRSIQGGKGYAATYLGLPYLHAFNFFVFTGDKFIKEAACYGEYTEVNPKTFDPKARSPFDPIKEFLGDPAIVNMNGPEVAKERKGIKNYLSTNRAEAAAWEVTDKLLRNWSNDKSLNHTICLLCTQVIAQGWFNLKDVPEALVPLLKTAEHNVFNRDKVSNADFEKNRAQIKAISDEVLTTQHANVGEEESYIGFLKVHRKKERVTDLNALAGLVVEGNITTVLTGAVLQLAANQNLQERLRQELMTLDPKQMRTAEGYPGIKNLPLLHQVYLESLRFFSPSPPMARYASKAGTINGVHIPARSYLFIPLRQIMHDPNEWVNPSAFDPSRHLGSNRHLNQYPLAPFSLGPRMCPASFGFAEAMFKVALVQLFRENQLSLTSHDSVEQIPVAIKEPRLKQAYFGNLRRAALEDEPHKVIQFSNTPPLDPYHALTLPSTLVVSAGETFAIDQAKTSLTHRTLSNSK